jgi:uncharacterized membrane protein
MDWFWLSLVTALTQAIKDACLKRCLDRMDVGAVMEGYLLAAAVFLWFGSALAGTPALGPGFWPLLAFGGLLGAVTFFLYGRALSAGDLSLTLPMLAFTPLFLLVTSPLTLGEFPELPGLAGMLLVVAGSYVLNLRERRKGFWGPIKALWTNRGSRLMLVVAVIWSVGANFDKVGLRASSPLFWIAAVYTASALGLLPGLSGRWRTVAGQLAVGPGLLLWAGLLEAVGVACQMQALTLTLVPYVIAVKRLSIVFGVLLGALLFREPDIVHRLPGALVMVVGVFFIAVFG